MVKYLTGKRIGRQGRLAIGCSAAIFDSTRQRILLARRSDNALWTVPGGYMEPGETLTEACAREVWEETGLHVTIKRLISVYTNPDLLLEYPDGNRLQLVVLHFQAVPIDGELGLSEETTALKYYAHSETIDLEMGTLDRLRVADSFTLQEATIIRDTF